MKETKTGKSPVMNFEKKTELGFIELVICFFIEPNKGLSQYILNRLGVFNDSVCYTTRNLDESK